MSTDRRNPMEETVPFRNTRPIAAAEMKSTAIDHPLLFHPLCAERLETAIECNLERLAAALQVAVSDVEKSISMLAQNSTIFGPNEIERLTVSLQEGLGALKHIQVSSCKFGSTLKEYVVKIRESVEIILESSKKIRSHRNIEKIIIEIDGELKKCGISKKKRDILEAQRTVLQSALNEYFDRREETTE